MPRKASQIILGDIISKVIEQEKWIEILGVSEAEGAPQVHAGTFERRLRLDHTLHRSNRH